MRGEMKSRYTAGQRVGTVAVCLVLMLLLSFWLFYEPDHGGLDPSEEQARAVADSLLSADVTRFRAEMLEFLHASHADLVKSVEDEKKFTDETKAGLNSAIEAFKTQFQPTV